MRNGILGDQEWSPRINRHNLIERVNRPICNIVPVTSIDAGVIHDDVESRQPPNGFRNNPLGFGDHGDVPHNPYRSSAGFVDLITRFLDSNLVTPPYSDGRALFRELD